MSDNARDGQSSDLGEKLLMSTCILQYPDNNPFAVFYMPGNDKLKKEPTLKRTGGEGGRQWQGSK